MQHKEYISQPVKHWKNYILTSHMKYLQLFKTNPPETETKQLLMTSFHIYSVLLVMAYNFNLLRCSILRFITRRSKLRSSTSYYCRVHPSTLLQYSLLVVLWKLDDNSGTLIRNDGDLWVGLGQAKSWPLYAGVEMREKWVLHRGIRSFRRSNK